MGNKNNEHIPTESTRMLVAALSAHGISQKAICFTLATFAKTPLLNVDTLRKHYKAELKSKKEFAEALVVGSLMRNILRGCSKSTIFYCKTQLGWRETINLDLNNPIPNFDLLPMDPLGEIIEGEIETIPERPLLG